MMFEAGQHLAKRAIKMGADCMEKGSIKMTDFQMTGNPDEDLGPLKPIAEKVNNPLAIIVLGLTLISFLVITFAINYSIRYVAINLTIVEDVGSGAIKLPDGDAAPLMNDHDADATVEAQTMSSAVPITASIRSTFRHLNAFGGFRSRFRGILHGMFYGLCFSIFSSLLSLVFGFIPFAGMILGNVGAGLLCCNIHAAWTHATIATKSDKPFFQRFLSRSAAKHLMLPTLRNQLALWITQGTSLGFAMLTKHVMNKHGLNWATSMLGLLPFVTGIVGFFFLIIPTYIALIRCEASLLPEDRTAIVPFDRTFGGRIAWKELDTRRAYLIQNFLMRGAYNVFDKDTYKRVIKMAVKYVVILSAISFIFVGIFVGEIFAFGNRVNEAPHAL